MDLFHHLEDVAEVLQDVREADLVEGPVRERPGQPAQVVDHVHARARDPVHAHGAGRLVGAAAEFQDLRRLSHRALF